MTKYEADRGKFSQLVLYIANRTKSDPTFGRTKLAKVFYYSDTRAYRDRGEPITGATYERRPHGPFPRELKPTELALHGEGKVEFAEGPDKYDPKRIIPRAEADLSSFEPWQIELVDAWIDRIQPLTASEASNRSHLEAGWMLAMEDRVEIPMASVRVSRRGPKRADFEWAKQVLRERGAAR